MEYENYWALCAVMWEKTALVEVASACTNIHFRADIMDEETPSRKRKMELDEIMKEVGEFTWYHLALVLVLSIPTYSAGLVAMSYVYVAATPAFWCKPNLPPSLSNLSHQARMNLSVPRVVDSQGKCVYDQCRMYHRNYSALLVGNTSAGIDAMPEAPIIPCTQWEYDTTEIISSIVTQVNTTHCLLSLR